MSARGARPTDGQGPAFGGSRESKRKEDQFRLVYHPGGRLKLGEKQAFEVAVGAILTQNTSWKNVEKAIIKLNQRNLIDPKKLIASNSLLLTSIIRPAGYFNQKAKKLKIFSRWLMAKGGNLLKVNNKSLNVLRGELLNLWGIGPETADSILLYALNKPVFVVDAYTRRVSDRLGWKLPRDYEGVRAFFENRIFKSVAIYQEFHALFVQLAKTNCFKNNPECLTCPLLKCCFYGHKNT